MNYYRISIFAFLILLFHSGCSSEKQNGRSEDMEWIEGEGYFEVKNELNIFSDEVGTATATFLMNSLQVPTHIDIKVVKQEIRPGIVLTYKEAPSSLSQDGFLLEVTPDMIYIRAKAATGIHQGIAQMLELLFEEDVNQIMEKRNKKLAIPCYTIKKNS